MRKSGGGWQAITYVMKAGWKVGFLKLWRGMSSKNACKTCAVGMGGQQGGMRNEVGQWPEVCKKSVQAMVSDMQGGLTEAFFREHSISDMQLMSPRELETAGRLSFPIILEHGKEHYRRMSWDEAYQRISAKLIDTPPEQSFFYFSGRSSNEAGFLLQLFARVYGTNHVNNCSFYCHQASGVALNDSIGSGTATISLSDLEHTDLVFLIGANPASNHPRLLTILKNIRKRGGHVVVINPMRETGLVNFKVPSDPWSMLRGSVIASDYVKVRVGGDIALLSGIAKVVCEQDAVDEAFVLRATEGFEEFKHYVCGLSWREIEEGSGVPEETVRHMARRYLDAKHAVFAWCMGITHHTHGVANIHTICNLAFLRGMVGRKNAGLLPIRGHSNVQGIGSMAVTPEVKASVLRRLSDFGIPVPAFKGYDTMACMEAADRGEMRFGYCLGGNLYGSNPDATFAARAISKIDLMVYLNTTLNLGHAWGLGKDTMILPVYARDEETQSTTQESMFNYVRLSDGGKERHADLRSEVEITCEVASRVAPNHPLLQWQALKDHNAIRELIAKVIPGYEPVAQIGTTKKEFSIEGRVLHSAKFHTASGKARFITHALPSFKPLAEREFTLMSVRSEGQFNTAVFEDYDLYRGQERRDVVLMCPDDMERLNVKRDQLVTVRSSVGAMARIRVRPFDLSPGTAVMYYPEVNRLIPRETDPFSKTPAFKSTRVEIV